MAAQAAQASVEKFLMAVPSSFRSSIYDVSIREALEAVIRTESWDVTAFESAASFLAYPPPGGPSCLVLDIGYQT
jgi:hypothetical protein